jgi:hypothetical protein
MPVEQIERIAKDTKTTPIYEVNIATALEKGVKTGSLTAFAYLLERTIGRVREDVDITFSDPDEELARERIRDLSLEELKAIAKERLRKEEALELIQ